MNVLRSASLGLGALLIMAMSGCSPRYFQADSVVQTLNAHFPAFPVDLRHFQVHYSMSLRQRTFFKNNIEETVLITDHSQLVNGGLLYFSDEEGASRGRRWHRIDAWLNSGADGSSGALIADQPVVLASSKGRLSETDEEEFELIRIYAGRVLGKVSDTDRLGRPLWQVRFDRAWQVTGKGEKQYLKIRDKDHVDLVVLLSYAPHGDRSEHLEVYTLIDRGQNQIGVEKAMIFDFRQIYGEPLWLIRNPLN